MRSLLLVSAALLCLALPAQAQNGSNNGNGNSGTGNGNFNGNGAGAGSGVGIGIGMASAAASVTAKISNTYKDRKQAPGIGLAGLAMGGLSCKGTASIGLSLPGGAGGIGFPMDDDECERRQWAGMMGNAQDPRLRYLAWVIMQRSRIVQQALQDAGFAVVIPAGGTAIAKGCNKWSGGALGVGKCVY